MRFFFVILNVFFLILIIETIIFLFLNNKCLFEGVCCYSPLWKCLKTKSPSVRVTAQNYKQRGAFILSCALIISFIQKKNQVY